MTASEQTNGSTAAAPGNAETSNVPVTKILSKFVATATFESLPQHAVEALKSLILDYLGNVAGGASRCDSSESIFHGVQAFSNGGTGKSTVFTKGHDYPPQFAAFMNAVYAHSLDFDDTFQAGSLHPGVTAISTALAQAELSKSHGKIFLIAVAVGYEVTCRLGRALGRGAYVRGFHNTSTAGIFGAVAAAAKLRGLDAATIMSAFGIAVSQAAGSMQYLENGSWNKRLHPGFAAHNAFMSLALAEAGVLAAEAPIEGKFGLLNGYSASSSLVGLVDGLGEQWCFLDTAIKPYPGCRATHGAIDLAAKMRQSAPKGLHPSLERVSLGISAAIFPIVGAPNENKIHPKNVVDAQFSVYYQLAVAWLEGNTGGLAVYDRLSDPAVHELTDRITVVAEQRMSGLMTRLTLHWSDGTQTEGEVHATQVAGEPANPISYAMCVQKFKSLAEPVFGGDNTNSIIDLVRKIEVWDTVKELLDCVV